MDSFEIDDDNDCVVEEPRTKRQSIVCVSLPPRTLGLSFDELAVGDWFIYKINLLCSKISDRVAFNFTETREMRLRGSTTMCMPVNMQLNAKFRDDIIHPI